MKNGRSHEGRETVVFLFIIRLIAINLIRNKKSPQREDALGAFGIGRNVQDTAVRVVVERR